MSLSSDPSRRNFTLGQDGNRYDVRFRTSSTDENGIPSLPAPENSLSPELTHVAYTRSASGQASIYLGGKRQATKPVEGSVANWSGEFRLLLANEQTGDRPWHGELHLVAIYGRALTEDEIRQNFAAGAHAKAFDYAALLPAGSQRQVDFVNDVQPILRERCFECHATETKKAASTWASSRGRSKVGTTARCSFRAIVRAAA